MDLVTDIKARLSIEELVGQYVTLKRSGRSFKALCPFHQEKTPSFYVSMEKQIAYCFGCQKGGDILQFYQEVEGVDFVTALKQLADRLGIDMSSYPSMGGGVKVSMDDKRRIADVHDIASRFFEEKLWAGGEGTQVLSYLHQRGLSDETIRAWRLGFSPDESDACVRYLLDNKIEHTHLLASGLALTRDTEGSKLFDRFRMRLMFPIEDSSGRMVAFGGRTLKKGMEPKYLNSPETSVYRKSEILYAFSRAKAAMREKRRAILVEGYMDVILCHQHGFTEAVGVSGTALTPQHAIMLKRIVDTAYVCLDADRAGWEAAQRAFLTLQEAELSVRCVIVPEGKDPAECLVRNPDAFSRAIEEAKPFIDVYLDKEVAFSDKRDPEETLRILRGSIPLLTSIQSRVMQDIAVRQFSARLGVREVAVYDELRRHQKNDFRGGISKRNEKYAAEKANASADPSSSQKPLPSELILALLFTYPEKASDVLHQLRDTDFPAGVFEIFRAFSEIVRLGETFSLISLKEQLAPDLHLKVDFLALYGEMHYAEVNVSVIEKDIAFSLDKVFRNRKNMQLEALKHTLRDAESSGRKEERQILLTRFRDILSE